MRRTPFLAIVGISSDTYKNMTRHGHAPVAMEDDSSSSWSEYSTGDVVKTALAIALNGEGLDKTTAAAVVNRGFHHVKTWWVAAGDQRLPAIYFGAALASWDAGDVEAEAWFPIGAPLSQIGECQIGHRTLHKLTDVESQVAKIVVVNLARVRAAIERRAEAAGLTFDFDDLAAI